VKQKLVFIHFFISVILCFCSCNSEEKITKYYYSNKTDIERIKSISEGFQKEYGFKAASFRELDEGIRFLLLDKDPFKGTGQYYNAKTLKVQPYFKGQNVCDSCTIEEREVYIRMYADPRFMQLLELYKKIKPKALQITSEGVFFALGDPIKSKNKMALEGGVLVPFAKDFDNGFAVKQIDNEQAYLYDKLVE
jgi:hypothetical protein